MVRDCWEKGEEKERNRETGIGRIVGGSKMEKIIYVVCTNGERGALTVVRRRK